MAAEGHCPVCSGKLDPAGLCPVCPKDLGPVAAADAAFESTLTLGSQVLPELPAIGPYQPTRLLGEGGMGAVYLAEQEEPIRRRVALKVIKLGMDSKEVIARFETERQALALMDHPNIARVLDAGATDEGRPYFAMEYVPGLPITAYCDRRRLSTGERIELFATVCGAVQHAHQKGIIHRDLKPSNVLVAETNGEAVAKVIDFGVAKAAAQRLVQRTAFTQLGQLIGTPEYMSPEQAELDRVDIDTRTDVYSLGMLLYELLVGALPFDPEELRRLGLEALLRKIRDDEPTKPSTRASARGEASESAARDRRTDPRTLAKQLKGELDWIVMKALEKDRARRYQTALELAADLGRFQRNEAVLAGPPSAAYRLRKFVRRHRVGVAATGLVFLTLVGGILATASQARRAKAEQGRAERRFSEVRKLAHALLFDYHDAIKDLPGATPVRARLVRDALENLDNLAGEAVGDPSLVRELAAAYEKVGDVQGGMTAANLGDTEGALASYRSAVRLHRGLLAAQPGNVESRRALAAVESKLGLLLGETGDVRGALEAARSALAALEDLSGPAGQDPTLLLELVRARDRVGILVQDTGDPESALDHFRRNLALLEARRASEPGSEALDRARSVAHEHAGLALLDLDDLQGALEQVREAVAVRASLAAQHPLNDDYRRILGLALYNEAEILENLGRFAEALESYRRSAAGVEALVATDPDNVQHRVELAFSLMRVGDMLRRLDKPDEALALFVRSEALLAGALAADPTNLEKRAALVEAKARICTTLARRGDPTARPACGRALALLEATTVDPEHAYIRRSMALAYADLADAHGDLAAASGASAGARLEDRRAACAMLGKALALWQDLAERGAIELDRVPRAQRAASELAVKCAGESNP